MREFRKTMISVATALALGAGAANAGVRPWHINYAGANAAGGLGITLNNPVSALVDEYKYTAESLIVFADGDGDGDISAGDEFWDYVVYRVDALNYGGNTANDADYILQNTQISGTVVAHGVQVDSFKYIVDTASIEFYFDGPGDTIFGTGGGTTADFTDLSTFTDGLLVQTGVGDGVGINGSSVPDGAIDLDFALTDVLSTLVDQDGNNYGAFELFDPFIELDKITFTTDSNNNQCGAATCGSTVASLAAFFEVDMNQFDYFFHTRSDGSATKIPEPAVLALMGMGLLGAGFARRRKGRKA